MVRPINMKTAHLACLKEALPKGAISLADEQEATIRRVVPHEFRDLINEDLFSFDKKAPSPVNPVRIANFKEVFAAFKAAIPPNPDHEHPICKPLEMFCAQCLAAMFGIDPGGARYPFAIANFRSSQYPQVWVKSPVQHSGETEKVVGFPGLRKKYRAKLRRLAFDQDVHDAELRAALSRRILQATIQSVSAFMGSRRDRTNHTERTGGNDVVKRTRLHQRCGVQPGGAGWNPEYLSDSAAPVAKGAFAVRASRSNDVIWALTRRTRHRSSEHLQCDLAPTSFPKTPSNRNHPIRAACCIGLGWSTAHRSGAGSKVLKKAMLSSRNPGRVFCRGLSMSQNPE